MSKSTFIRQSDSETTKVARLLVILFALIAFTIGIKCKRTYINISIAITENGFRLKLILFITKVMKSKL